MLGGLNCWGAENKKTAPAPGELTEWLCTPEGGTPATLAGEPATF